jgi:hypothetical protein
VSSKHHELADFIWSVADLLRGDYKRSDYGKVILPGLDEMVRVSEEAGIYEPRTAVPIHQAILSAPGQQLHYRLLENFSPQGTTVRVLEPGNATTLYGH